MILHDPVPDGKSGPWLREPHKTRPEGGLDHDDRCQRCLMELAQKHPALVRGPNYDVLVNDPGRPPDDVRVTAENGLDTVTRAWVTGKIRGLLGRTGTASVYDSIKSDQFYFEYTHPRTGERRLATIVVTDI